VLSFTYKVYKVGGADGFEPGHILGGTVPFPTETFDNAAVVENFGKDCLSTSADNVQMLLMPNGEPCISVFTHHGTKAEAEADLERLGAGYGGKAAPPKDGVKPIEWTKGVQTLTAMGDPNGAGDLLAPGNPFYYTAGAVLRCWDPAHGPTGGAPDSKTIIACHARVWGKHLGEIRAIKGCMVGARSGHRRAAKPNKRGGKRVKGPSPHEGPGEWLNDDARRAQVEMFERCEAGVGNARR